MKPHRTRTGRYSLLITLPALVTLILMSSPLVPPAGAAETPSTAELLTQAGEMDSSTPAAEPQTATATTTAVPTPAAEPQTATTTAVPTPAATTTPTDSDAFDAAQLEQLVAPIALYPDALLMQILMAATYPLEIVEADRWISGQPDLKGDALNKALLEQDWDPSVESLTTLPSVLKQMSENLDWTQDLGDAFLAQEDDLLDTVQRMRGKAYEAGNLETTEQQTVTQQADKIIVIESASPEVVYVPTYSPTVVYGPAWGYPSYYYPSYYYPPAPGYGLLAFGAGVAVGAALWGGCNWGWGNNDVNIDIDRNTEFNRNTNNNFEGGRGEGGRGEGGRGEGGKGQGGKGSWQHDSSHRKGVNYNNSSVAQKHGASSGSNRVTKSEARGRSSATASNRAGTGAQAGNRGSASSRPSTSTANRGTGSASSKPSASTANRSAGGSSAARSPSTANRSSGGSSALSGSRSPSTDRMSSSRGASSRDATSYGGSRGGASRGGGGRRR